MNLVGSIKCGDSLSILKYYPNEYFNLIATDPPYRLTPRGNSGNAGGMLKKQITNLGRVFVHNDIKIEDWLPEFYRVLKSGSHCYIMTNHKTLFII